MSTEIIYGIKAGGFSGHYTAISRKDIGKSARDNPERHCGLF